MTKFEKALERLKTIPKDFTYDEMKSLLEHLGFEEINKGKTSGSAISFVRTRDKRILCFTNHIRAILLNHVTLRNLLSF